MGIFASTCAEPNYESREIGGSENVTQESRSSRVMLSGHILDSIVKKSYYLDEGLGSVEINLDSNHFYIRLVEEHPQIVHFQVDLNIYPIYLEDNDSLYLEFFETDLENNFNRISFSGGHSYENKVLLQLREILKFNSTDHNYFYNCSESAFLGRIDSLRDRSIDLMLANESKVTEIFKSMYTKYVDYELAQYIIRYPRTLRHSFANGIVEKGRDLLRREEGDFIEDPNLLNTAAYREYLKSKMYTSVSSVFYHHDYDRLGRSRPTLELSLDIVDVEFSNREIRDYLKFSLILYEINYGFGDVVSALERYRRTEPSGEYLRLLERTMAGKEERSGGYVFEDSSGLDRSLSEFRGKIIYADFWATWCAPCLMERKHFERLITAFEMRKNDIEFVGISLDTDVGRWRAMLKNGKIKGTQLISKKAFDSEICRDFKIQGIPRFMIFDRNGTVIRPDAIRPSRFESEKYLIELIDEM